MTTIFTADRLYGSTNFTKQLSENGYSNIFIMQYHLLSIHPFVGCSNIVGFHEDLQEKQQELENKNRTETEQADHDIV